MLLDLSHGSKLVVEGVSFLSLHRLGDAAVHFLQACLSHYGVTIMLSVALRVVD